VTLSLALQKRRAYKTEAGFMINSTLLNDKNTRGDYKKKKQMPNINFRLRN
jgi:hypothetical protein